jgi:hypothetical protein
LVYLFVFGTGTGGLGGGGGGWWPFGQSGGAGPGKGGAADTRPTPTRPEKPAGEETVVIQMRGGKEAEADQRFYVLDNQAVLPLDELQKALLQRRPKIKVIEIVIGKGSVDKESPAVRALQQWGREQGFQVKTVES